MLKLSRLAYWEALQRLEGINPEDLRPVDYKEFSDVFPRYNRSDFRTLLCIALGLLDVGAGVIFASNGVQPVFIATCSSRGGDRPKRLCGFGWLQADPITTRQERLQITRFGVEELILKDHSANKFDCMVHSENRDTLASWAIIGKLYSDQLTVNFVDSTLWPGYVIVQIEKKEHHNHVL